MDGGVDLLLVETIFDTLNAKAALFAIDQFCESAGMHIPVMISGTITDASGRTLSGQTPKRSGTRCGMRKPITVGLNCALGAKLMRPYIEEIAQRRRHLRCARIPMPACRIRSRTGYDETPEQTGVHLLREFATERLRQHRRRLLRHDAGAHQGDRGRGARACRRARCRRSSAALRLSGLEPLNIGDDIAFVNVGERTNVTGSPGFAKLILNGDYRRGA